MEGVIFIGIQASGKSTFYIENFFDTHVRISMDLLNTRNKELQFLHKCSGNTATPLRRKMNLKVIRHMIQCYFTGKI